MSEFDYEAIPEGYYDRIYHSGPGARSLWHRLKFQRVIAEMGDYRNHLDFGCGPGTLIGALPHDRSSIGVDIARSQIDYAVKSYRTENHRFELVDGQSLPFPSNHFDCVTCIEVFEHLPMDAIEGILRQLHQILAPGGRLIVTTPNYHSIWPLLEFFVNQTSDVSYEEQHITRFNRRLLAQTLDYEGFVSRKILRIQSMAFLAGAFPVGIARPTQWLLDQLPPPFSGILLMGVCTK